MTNTLGIMMKILNNYPWTILLVGIIGVIKRQFFHIVTHVFDNSNLSQEIFAIDNWGAVICSLEHGRKHMLTIFLTIWRPGFTFLLCQVRKFRTFINFNFGVLLQHNLNFIPETEYGSSISIYHSLDNTKKRNFKTFF